MDRVNDCKLLSSHVNHMHVQGAEYCIDLHGPRMCTPLDGPSGEHARYWEATVLINAALTCSDGGVVSHSHEMHHQLELKRKGDECESMGHMHFGTLGASLAKGLLWSDKASNYAICNRDALHHQAWTSVEQGHCGLRVKCTLVLGHRHLTLKNCLPRDYEGCSRTT
jgi:hypothetical protein